MITACRRRDESVGIYHSYLDIEIFDFYTFDLIDTISIFIGEYLSSGTKLSNVNYIKPIVLQDTLVFYVGITTLEFEEGYYSTDIYNTELLKISFNEESLSLIENIEDCGKSLNRFIDFGYLVATGSYYHHFYHDFNESWETRRYYIKLLTLENPTQEIDMLNLEGQCTNGFYYSHYPRYLNILSNNDENYLEYGLTFYFKLFDSDYGNTQNFINYSPDCTDTLWYDLNSNIIENTISASTSITVNNENHYIIYFNENQLEIRDRVNGNIIHHQDSTIDPFLILKKSDGELLYITENGQSYDVYILEGEIQVSVNNNQISTATFDLQNYPNPFNPSTTINFSIKNESKVKLSIFNIKGQKIKTLVNTSFTRGDHSIVWKGDDENRNPVSSGVYIYKLYINGKTESVKKCLLLK